jgi:Transcription factor WhiB
MIAASYVNTAEAAFLAIGRRAPACKGGDPELFFGFDGESASSRQAREAVAKEVCGACPAKARCLAFALEQGEWFGVWGGLTGDERRALPKPASPYCSSGRHLKTAEITAGDGRCLVCKREQGAANYRKNHPVPGPGRGVSDIPRQRDRRGHFTKAADPVEEIAA